MSRPSIFTMLLIAAFAGIAIPVNAQNTVTPPQVKHLIDTHIHIYDTGRDVYDPNHPNSVPWPPMNDAVLHKPHLPREYRSISKPAGVTGVIVVEASPRVDDNQWVLDQVKGDDFFVGLVGNLDPLSDSFGINLENLKKDPRLVGIRVHLMNQPKGIEKNPKLLESLREMEQAGLALDVLMNAEGPMTINVVNRIAKQFPKLSIIVNHVLGYNIDGKTPSEKWIKAVERLAKNQNVSVKISGLYQRSVQQPAPQDIAYYDEVLDILWKNFGSERLIYGSNWPVTKKSGDYASFVQLVNRYFSAKGQEASEHFFWKNAANAYHLNIK